jgi:hypothetical protein
MTKTGKKTHENKERKGAKVIGTDGIDIDEEVDILHLSTLSHLWKKVLSFFPPCFHYS